MLLPRQCELAASGAIVQLREVDDRNSLEGQPVAQVVVVEMRGDEDDRLFRERLGDGEDRPMARAGIEEQRAIPPFDPIVEVPLV